MAVDNDVDSLVLDEVVAYDKLDCRRSKPCRAKPLTHQKEKCSTACAGIDCAQSHSPALECGRECSSLKGGKS